MVCNSGFIDTFANQNLVMRKKLMTCLLMAICTGAMAQDNTSAGKSFGKGSLNFINNSVYYGRKDSVTTPYLTPALGYYHKSGFFIEGSLSYLLRSGNGRVDLSTISAGYDFAIGNFGGGIAADKYFYNSNSTNVSAEISGDLFATAAWDFGFLETYLMPGINFGNKSDFWLSWGIDRVFTAANDRLEITPSFSLNATTRNLYASYFGNRRFKPKKGNQPPTVTATMKDASKLSIQSYEFSVPVSYTIKNFTLGFTPYFAIAKNPAVVTIVIKPVVGPGITKVITEEIDNTFYFSLDAAIKF